MNFWMWVAGWIVASLIVMAALSINGVTEAPAGGHGHDDHGHGHDDHGHGGGHGHH